MQTLTEEDVRAYSWPQFGNPSNPKKLFSISGDHIILHIKSNVFKACEASAMGNLDFDMKRDRGNKILIERVHKAPLVTYSNTDARLKRYKTL